MGSWQRMQLHLFEDELLDRSVFKIPASHSWLVALCLASCFLDHVQMTSRAQEVSWVSMVNLFPTCIDQLSVSRFFHGTLHWTNLTPEHQHILASNHTGPTRTLFPPTL